MFFIYWGILDCILDQLLTQFFCYVPTKSIGLFGVFLKAKYWPWLNLDCDTMSPDVTDSSHFTSLALVWTGLLWSLFCWTHTLDQCLHKELEFPTWLSSHCCCLSTFLVLRTGKTWVLRCSFRHCTSCTPDPILKPKLYFFFFLAKDRESNSMLFPSFKYWFFSSISLLLFPLQCLQIIVFFIFYSELILVICRKIHLQDLTHPYRSVT